MTVRPKYLVLAVLALLAVGTGLYWHATRELVDGSFEAVDLDVPWSSELPDYIDPSGKTSSRCIGKPTTPICAVETYLACMIWERPDLCRMVRDHHRDDGKTKYLTRTYRLNYLVRTVDRPDDLIWPHLLGENYHYDLLTVPNEDIYKRGDPRMVWVIAEQRGCTIDVPEECTELDKYKAMPPQRLFEVKTFEYILVPEKRRWKIIWNDIESGPGIVVYSDDTIAVGAYHPSVTFYEDTHYEEPD